MRINFLVLSLIILQIVVLVLMPVIPYGGLLCWVVGALLLFAVAWSAFQGKRSR
ncbi:hypothetical protein [uncultured Lacticaseibacillus sp.]|uniref:hypothetical protein n=1 Tax=uncultured Lacticaseibacillus sp. TaxID=2775882 RepID=UPI0025918177|nr:hypothetical protein [uncultured Lacticaseibacillus sp.]